MLARARRRVARGCGVVARFLGGQDVALALQVALPLVVEQGLHGLALNGLALEQHLGHEVELVAAHVEDLLGAAVRLAHDALHLNVDPARGLLGVVLVVSIVAAQEHLMLRLAEHLRAELLAHAQARDHLARHLGRALQVVRGARGDVVAHEFLGGAAAQEHGELVEHLVLGLEEVVLGRQLQRVAQSLTARDDRDLVHRIGMLQHVPHERMAALVVGDRAALCLGHHAGLLLRAGDHALHRLLDFVHRDHGAVAARGEERGLVEQVRKVGAGESHGELGELVKPHVLVERLVLGVHAQDRLAALDVGAVDRDLTVKAARAQQRRVEDVGAVGRGQEDHALVLLKAVHLNEQLVERLLALVVTAAEAGAALASDRVDLVDKDDRRALGLGLLEQVAHARGAHAHEHLNKVRARDAEERHARLAGNGLGEQRLTRARRAHEQAAARDLGAERTIALRIGEEVADLLELLNGLVDARHVGELDVRARGLGHLGVRLAELHGLAVGAHHLAHEVHHDGDQRERGQDGHRDVGPEVRVVVVHDELRLGMLGHEARERVVAGIGRAELLGRLGVLLGLLVRPVGARHRAVRRRVGERLNAVLLDSRHHLARGELDGVARGGEVRAHVKEQVGEQAAGEQEVQPRHAARRLLVAAGAELGRQRVAAVRVMGTVALGKESDGGSIVVGIETHPTSKPPV